MVTAEKIRHIVESIPDPEIPVLTLGDLGIIRAIAETADGYELAITPTYSGCPATKVIAQDITTALKEAGYHNVTLKQVISPPWSTNWISTNGHQKLLAYGIAPPNLSANSNSEKSAPAACPQCQATQLERISEFGPTPCQSMWRCMDCQEVFNYFKCL